MNGVGLPVALAVVMMTAFFSGSAAAQTEIVLQAASAPIRVGRWVIGTDASAAGGALIRHPNRGARKIGTALVSPSDYFEMTFEAEAGTPYRLWVRGRADGNYWGNDSVYVQFSGSTTASGVPIYRIGTTSAADVNLEDCRHCGGTGWRWQDNGYGRGVLGRTIYFARGGWQRLRVQAREDGIAIDQIVLSASKYLHVPPSGIARASGSTPPPVPTAPRPAPAPTTRPPQSAPAPNPPALPVPSDGSATLKVLDWNIHHGIGTDGACNLDRFAGWIVKSGANVVSLNEVEKYTGWCGSIDMPARIASLLKSKTGKTWHYNFAERYGNTNGQGNLILTTLPIQSAGDHQLSFSRSVARVELLVGSRRVNIFSTHLDADSSSRRATQIRELNAWAATYPEQRIVVGDFNAWPGASEIAAMTAGHHDAWTTAKQAGKAVAYSGNEAGNTRRSRIDYIFFSKGAAGLSLKESRVFDVRDSRGVMPSDHRPLMATYDVH